MTRYARPYELRIVYRKTAVSRDPGGYPAGVFSEGERDGYAGDLANLRKPVRFRLPSPRFQEPNFRSQILKPVSTHSVLLLKVDEPKIHRRHSFIKHQFNDDGTVGVLSDWMVMGDFRVVKQRP